MVNGLYTASRGMMNILSKQDISANNLANSNTHGFKSSQIATHVEIQIGKNEEKQWQQNERQTLGEVYTDFTQGPMIETQSHLDAALNGPGFFTVETADGIQYTRNGSFTLNGNQQLVTLTGHRVLDENQKPIMIRGQEFQIREDGALFSEGNPQGRLGLIDFPIRGTKSLFASGDGLLKNRDPKGNPPIKALNTSAKQGFLEGSNVDTVSSMVAMIVQTRNYEADMKALQSIDQTLSKAVNEIGRVG